jgi:hypothetical protein
MVDVLREQKKRGAACKVDALDAYQYDRGRAFEYEDNLHGRVIHLVPVETEAWGKSLPVAA